MADALRRLALGGLALFLGAACATPAGLVAPPPGEAGAADHAALAADEAVPWTHLDADDAPEDFKFALISDRTGHARAGVFAQGLGKLALLQPAFVVSVGDLIEGYTEDPAQLAAEWDEFDAMLEVLEAPFFYAAGNHDYSNPPMARDWVRRFGSSYYHFLYRGVLFLVLNSELFASVSDPSQPIRGAETVAEQMAFAEAVLREHADARWTVVIVHQPLWDHHEPHPEWLRFESLLGARPHTVFAGHRHAYTKHVRNERSYITLATTGGVSRLRGLDRGEFDHVALVTMSDEGPVMANLMLDGIHDEDVRSAATRRLVRQLSKAVVIEPLRVGSGRFARGTQRIRVDNPSEAPLRVRARFEPGPALRAEPAALERELAPGASETLEVALVAETPRPPAELAPAVAVVELEAAGERGPVRVEGRGWLFPDRLFPVPAASAPRRVDGELGDWGRLRFAMADWPTLAGARAEVSLRFDVAVADGDLLLAFDVRDTTPVYDPALPANQQDGVRLSIDARPEPLRSSNPNIHRALRDGFCDALLLVTLTPRGAAPSEVGLLPTLPESVERAVVATPEGYRAELRVPGELLDERAGGPWRRFRLNAVLQDFSPGEAEGPSHAWRPVRYGIDGLPVEGAGTFERAD